MLQCVSGASKNEALPSRRMAGVNPSETPPTTVKMHTKEPGDVLSPAKWSTPRPEGDPEVRQAERLAREFGGSQPVESSKLYTQLSPSAMECLTLGAVPQIAGLEGIEPPDLIDEDWNGRSISADSLKGKSRNDDSDGNESNEENDAALDSGDEVTAGEQVDIATSEDIDLGKWGEWITAICVVGFDLELGQNLEKLYPLGISLEQEDVKHISFLSFPDSNTGCTGDSTFSFRIRSSTGSLPRFSTVNRKKRYLFGSVYFRQVPDPTSRRGYYQKSVVVLSEHPYSALFARISKLVAKAYFEEGAAAIATACEDIQSWATPIPGTTASLKLLRYRLQVAIPANISSIQFSPEASCLKDGKALVASSFAGNLYKNLKPLIPSLQILWELMLTAEPVIVRGSSPGSTSSTVLSLVSLIAPLHYMGDFRPYFTIHDSDCQVYVKHANQHPCAILGVTNPYFDKALASWPTVVKLAEPTKRAPIRVGLPGSPDRLVSRAVSSGNTGGTLRNGKTQRSGVQTKCKQVLDHDRKFLRELLGSSGANGASHELSNEIRAHFWNLTQQFLIPLESYASRLMPRKNSITPFGALPKLSKFNTDEFLATLKSMGRTIPGLKTGTPRKGDWLQLYKRFLQSPNFVGWFATKKAAANTEIMRIYLSKTRDADFISWTKLGKSEVQVMDLFLRVKEALVFAEKDKSFDAEMIAACWLRVADLTDCLPSDIRESLAMSPIGKLAKARSSLTSPQPQRSTSSSQQHIKL